jgi:hypothetical protein
VVALSQILYGRKQLQIVLNVKAAYALSIERNNVVNMPFNARKVGAHNGQRIRFFNQKSIGPRGHCLPNAAAPRASLGVLSVRVSFSVAL